jgi:threonine dehydratase
VTVVAARTANPFKIERITAMGARVRLAGDDIEDARLLARTIAGDEGAHLVEDSLDLSTCEGAGTIGLELLEGLSQLDTLVIALGGGALASGVGHVARSLAPCGCSTGTRALSSSPRRLSVSPLCWRTASASLAGVWPRSSAAATSRLGTTNAGC